MMWKKWLRMVCISFIIVVLISEAFLQELAAIQKQVASIEKMMEETNQILKNGRNRTLWNTHVRQGDTHHA